MTSVLTRTFCHAFAKSFFIDWVASLSQSPRPTQNLSKSEHLGRPTLEVLRHLPQTRHMCLFLFGAHYSASHATDHETNTNIAKLKASFQDTRWYKVNAMFFSMRLPFLEIKLEPPNSLKKTPLYVFICTGVVCMTQRRRRRRRRRRQRRRNVAYW